MGKKPEDAVLTTPLGQGFDWRHGLAVRFKLLGPGTAFMWRRAIAGAAEKRHNARGPGAVRRTIVLLSSRTCFREIPSL
jgi:hypothetical protein